MEGISPEKVQQFAFIANAYESTIGNMLAADVVTPMGYFVFKK
jgi:hypothetical protein